MEAKIKTEVSPVKHVFIYTDGYCLGEQDAGGYGTILTYEGHRKEISGGYRLTTCNRMEIFACIAGVQALKYICSVTIYNDSPYFMDSVSKGYMQLCLTTRWGSRKYLDLWKQLAVLCQKHEVAFEWCGDDFGKQSKEIQRCEELAKKATLDKDLKVDSDFEGEFTKSEKRQKNYVGTQSEVHITQPSKTTGKPKRKVSSGQTWEELKQFVNQQDEQYNYNINPKTTKKQKKSYRQKTGRKAITPRRRKGYCIDCDDKIPEKRLQVAPNANRCVPCQENIERLNPSDYKQRISEGLVGSREDHKKMRGRQWSDMRKRRKDMY